MYRRAFLTLLAGSRLAAGETVVGPPYAHRALDVTDEVGYYIDPPRPQLGGRPGDSELARWALLAWDNALQGLLCVVPRSAEDALIRIYWGQLAKGLGRMQTLDVGGRRASEVYVETDLSRFDPNFARLAESDNLLRDVIAYRTLLHEIGHALGLVHSLQPEDAMYYGGDVVRFYKRYRERVGDRGDMRRFSGLSQTDKQRVRLLYSGALERQTTPDANEKPTPGPTA